LVPSGRAGAATASFRTSAGTVRGATCTCTGSGTTGTRSTGSRPSASSFNPWDLGSCLPAEARKSVGGNPLGTFAPCNPAFVKITAGKYSPSACATSCRGLFLFMKVPKNVVKITKLIVASCKSTENSQMCLKTPCQEKLIVKKTMKCIIIYDCWKNA